MWWELIFQSGDFAWMRLIADKCSAVLKSNLMPISGLVTTTECRSPFDHCDVVTSTNKRTYPRGGTIFFWRGKNLRKRSDLFSQGDENEL